MATTFTAAFESHPELFSRGSSGLLLFALGLRFGISDVESLAADALTDGPDDKKCDLVYVNIDDEYAVIAQGYLSEDATKSSAPANKASDLNTAVAWLMTRQVDNLPERLKPSGEQLQQALQENRIRDLHLWYVHNLPESSNVEDELQTVEYTAVGCLTRYNCDPQVEVSAMEVGQSALDAWYKSQVSPIAVGKTFRVPVHGSYVVEQDDWTALSTTVPLSWLYDVYRVHKQELFSANVRGYLGSRRSDRNINYGIKQTAEIDPSNFWVYNNGLTVLVEEFERVATEDTEEVVITGLSVVNGAQTTGAIGSLLKAPSRSAFVPVRFVKSNNPETVKSIIRYNNSQNKIEAPDFRSGDNTQTRLRSEFEGIPSATYLGGRRGGDEDIIRRPGDLIPSDTAAQALVAFHQDPITAYNSKSEIWGSDQIYSKHFSDHTHANHLVFCYSLLRAIEGKKRALIDKENANETLTTIESSQLDFLRRRGSSFLLLAAIAKCMETFLNRAVPNLFRLSFNDNPTPSNAQEHWAPIVESTMSFVGHLSDAIGFGLKTTSDVSNALVRFSEMVQATREWNATMYEAFAELVDG